MPFVETSDHTQLSFTDWGSGPPILFTVGLSDAESSRPRVPMPGLRPPRARTIRPAGYRLRLRNTR
jgi:hypothetical protein